MHSIRDIAARTGLKEDFIRRCEKELRGVLSAKRGDKNSLVFDNNALIIFDHIRELKLVQGLSLPEIVREVKNSLKTPIKDSQTDTQNSPKQTSETAETEGGKMSQTERELYERLLAEQAEKHKAEKAALESRVLLLTDGRNDEEIRQHREQQERERITTAQRLGELEAARKAEEGKRQRRATLLKAYEETSFFARGKRRQIMAQLRELDAGMEEG